MKLFVGLGNPGKQYEHTRHNVGYDVIDAFSDMIGCDIDRRDFKGEYGLLRQNPFGEPIILLKPTTYMNLSGESVRAIYDYFKMELDDIVIIYDDMALPVGKIRLRQSGSAGSHNGMKNIIQHLGTENIKRLRVGIGEPLGTGVDYVLGKPSPEDRALLEEGYLNACRALKMFLQEGWNKAMTTYNQANGTV